MTSSACRPARHHATPRVQGTNSPAKLHNLPPPIQDRKRLTPTPQAPRFAPPAPAAIFSSSMTS